MYIIHQNYISGPVIPEVTSIWFKMFLYHVCQAGPPSLLLPKGTVKHIEFLKPKQIL